jgi:hypothetical protein
VVEPHARLMARWACARLHSFRLLIESSPRVTIRNPWDTSICSSVKLKGQVSGQKRTTRPKVLRPSPKACSVNDYKTLQITSGQIVHKRPKNSLFTFLYRMNIIRAVVEYWNHRGSWLSVWSPHLANSRCVLTCLNRPPREENQLGPSASVDCGCGDESI